MKSNVADELVESLTEARDLLRAGRTDRLSLRQVRRVPPPHRYTATAVRSLRHKLNVSQSVFAALLGISVTLAQSWEQGKRQPSSLACRLLDVVKNDLPGWKRFVQAA